MTFACVLGGDGGSGPVGRVKPGGDAAMERSVGPVGDIGHQAVFYRIEMNIVDMRTVIAVVANCVFPEASLPDTPLGLGGSTG